MAERDKLTNLMKRAAPFIAGVSGDVNAETVDQDIQAMLLALQTHKESQDHEPFDHAWAGNNSFLSDLLVNTILPLMPDTFDVGSDTYRFRKGFFSELSSLIFNRENIVVLDGQFLVTKMAGTVPVDTTLGTTIDFGRTMTVGDFVLFRNEGQVEYMKITYASGGTIYRVTRNLDGSGANNWVEGTPFAVLGSAGEGWLELNAVDRKRFSVWLQGTTYNNSLEIGRYGDITGWQNSTYTGMGIALGDYAGGKYLVYTTTDGMVINGGSIMAGNGNVVIDQNGLQLYSNTVYNELADPSSIKFIHDGVPFGGIQGGGSPSDCGISILIEGTPGKQVDGLDTVIAQDDGLAYKRMNTYRETTSSPYILDKASYNTKVTGSESLIEISAEHNHLNSNPVYYHTALLKLWATITGSVISMEADRIELTAPNGIIANNPITLPAADPTLPNEAVRKAYVDQLGTWKAWDPTTITGWAVSFREVVSRYCKIGKLCHFAVRINGTSNSPAASLTLPFTAANVGNNFWWNGDGAGTNGGVNLTTPLRWGIENNTNLLVIWTNYAGATWNSSGAKQAYISGFYETA